MNEWENEEDKVDFEHSGLKCAMRKGPFGHWCGYVGVSEDHSGHGKHYDDFIDLDVHGGLTYAEDHAACDDAGDLWWFGFDCAHAGDLCPSAKYSHDGDVYRNQSYVEAECRSLADQLVGSNIN